MPQLDKYLISLEVVWFISLFILGYWAIYRPTSLLLYTLYLQSFQFLKFINFLENLVMDLKKILFVNLAIGFLLRSAYTIFLVFLFQLKFSLVGLNFFSNKFVNWFFLNVRFYVIDLFFLHVFSFLNHFWDFFYDLLVWLNFLDNRFQCLLFKEFRYVLSRI